MKKLLFLILVISVFLMFSTKTQPAVTIADGVKVIVKYCKNLSKGRSDAGSTTEDCQKNELEQKSATMLPFYFWDTKMMIR